MVLFWWHKRILNCGNPFLVMERKSINHKNFDFLQIFPLTFTVGGVPYRPAIYHPNSTCQISPLIPACFQTPTQRNQIPTRLFLVIYLTSSRSNLWLRLTRDVNRLPSNSAQTGHTAYVINDCLSGKIICLFTQNICNWKISGRCQDVLPRVVPAGSSSTQDFVTIQLSPFLPRQRRNNRYQLHQCLFRTPQPAEGANILEHREENNLLLQKEVRHFLRILNGLFYQNFSK